jgi:uncharacterized membrane protein
MESVLHYIAKLQLHPTADHFTVSILIIAVLIDLVASLAPGRFWLRYTALLLLVIGAIFAGASFFTGDMEADRIWNALGQPARDVLKRHAQLGEYLAITFGVLALWRIMIQAFGFMAGSRGIYLIFAVVAAIVLGYTAHLGGVLVYDYGAGTALMASAPVATESATPAASPGFGPSSGALPTVTVPTPQPGAPGAASAPPTAAAPMETARPTDAPTSSPTAVPSGSPSAVTM